jgi:hypothetical protein
MITIEQLEEMFENMRSSSGWNTDTELLWGYFFTDTEPGPLRLLAGELQEMGYRFVDLYPTDDEGEYFLHMEKIERHSPASLNARNAELESLAASFNVATYDGMDVGPVPQ